MVDIGWHFGSPTTHSAVVPDPETRGCSATVNGTLRPREQKITLCEMRSGNGPTRLIVYCSDFKCAHSVVIDAGRWGDDVRLSDLEPKLHVSGLWPPWRRCQAAVRARENGNGRRLIAFKPRAGPPRRIGMTASAYPPAGAFLIWQRSGMWLSCAGAGRLPALAQGTALVTPRRGGLGPFLIQMPTHEKTAAGGQRRLLSRTAFDQPEGQSHTGRFGY